MLSPPGFDTDVTSEDPEIEAFAFTVISLALTVTVDNTAAVVALSEAYADQDAVVAS